MFMDQGALSPVRSNHSIVNPNSRDPMAMINVQKISVAVLPLKIEKPPQPLLPPLGSDFYKDGLLVPSMAFSKFSPSFIISAQAREMLQPNMNTEKRIKRISEK